MGIDEALRRFLVQLEADGRSEHTRRQYARHVRLLGSWIDRQGRRRGVEAVCHEDLAGFLASDHARLSGRGEEKKATSLNALRSSLRCFFRFLHEAGYVPENPARLIRRARCAGPPPRGLGETDQKRLIATLQKDAGGSRDHVLFLVMMRTGIRVGSAVALRVEDVDPDTGEIVVRRAKGDAPDVTYVKGQALKVLRGYIRGLEDGPLFPGPSGRPITARHVRRRLSYWLQQAGIDRPGSPHSLRHGFAQRLYERTGDLLLVQRALGHRSIASTTVYARASRRRLLAAL